MQEASKNAQIVKTKENLHIILQKNLNQRHPINLQKENVTDQPLDHQIIKLTRLPYAQLTPHLLPVITPHSFA